MTLLFKAAGNALEKVSDVASTPNRGFWLGSCSGPPSLPPLSINYPLIGTQLLWKEIPLP